MRTNYTKEIRIWAPFPTSASVHVHNGRMSILSLLVRLKISSNRHACLNCIVIMSFLDKQSLAKCRSMHADYIQTILKCILASKVEKNSMKLTNNFYLCFWAHRRISLFITVKKVHDFAAFILLSLLAIHIASHYLAVGNPAPFPTILPRLTF